MRGKTIRQFLIDGQADGRWASELSNWTGKAYKIPRTYINQCTDRDDLSNTGVYFLFGRNDETDEEQVYIGEAENIFNRLKQHLSEKDFWTECIVFISKDNKRIVVPMFQRGKRWSRTQEQVFIDSLIKGYPVGTMLFYETFEDNKRTYILVDGLQRGNSIKKYALSIQKVRHLTSMRYTPLLGRLMKNTLLKTLISSKILFANMMPLWKMVIKFTGTVVKRCEQQKG